MIKQFILNNNITQIYNSKGTQTGPKGYPKYKSNKENTLFWGMYRKEDIKLCLNHKGKRWIYWHDNDCNPNYIKRVQNVKKIKKLKNTIHLCNKINTANYLKKLRVKYINLEYIIEYKFDDINLCQLISQIISHYF